MKLRSVMQRVRTQKHAVVVVLLGKHLFSLGTMGLYTVQLWLAPRRTEDGLLFTPEHNNVESGLIDL